MMQTESAQIWTSFCSFYKDNQCQMKTKQQGLRQPKKSREKGLLNFDGLVRFLQRYSAPPKEYLLSRKDEPQTRRKHNHAHILRKWLQRFPLQHKQGSMSGERICHSPPKQEHSECDNFAFPWPNTTQQFSTYWTRLIGTRRLKQAAVAFSAIAASIVSKQQHFWSL